MAGYKTIRSTEELDTLLSTNTYVLIDFWAIWCPPCKAIAPLFDRLASQNTIPGGLAFAKVDVDAQVPVAKRYGIAAMPTFLLLENGKELKTVKGAIPAAIRDLVKHAKTELAKEKKQRGEEVDEKELENDGVDESVLPKQSIDFSTLFTILLVFIAMWYYTSR